MPDELLVSCYQLVKVYYSPSGPVQAVRGVDLDLECGVTVGVGGASGSGKSSLLRMIAGLDRPTAGSVTVAGHRLAALSHRERARVRGRLLTHIYQRPRDNLLDHLSVAQQLQRLAPRRACDGIVDRALTSLDLRNRRDQVPAELSGGEQQRLALARALVAGHALVVADEPTAQLDSASAKTVVDAIAALAANGVTVVVATHDHRLLTEMNQVITLRDGAVTSVDAGGGELAVIDSSGRLQLPENVQRHFVDRRARLHWDPDDRRLIVDPP